MKSAEDNPPPEPNDDVDNDAGEEQLGRGARTRAKVIDLISVVLNTSLTSCRPETRGWRERTLRKSGQLHLMGDSR